MRVDRALQPTQHSKDKQSVTNLVSVATAVSMAIYNAHASAAAAVLAQCGGTPAPYAISLPVACTTAIAKPGARNARQRISKSDPSV